MTTIEVMLELLRSSIFSKNARIPENVIIDWDELMDLCVEHGVLAWVWDAICNLPQSQRPPRLQSINWGLSAQEIWDTYQKQEQVLLQMVKVCQNNNMRLLLLKGIGLSKLYPKPQSRSCGDIDIYLYDDYEKGNRIFCSGIAPETELHSEFDINNVRIENHKFFIFPNTKIKKAVGQYVLNHQGDVILQPEGYFVLSPLPNLAYLLMHMLNHFYYSVDSKVISIRNITDVAMFIYMNKSYLRPQETYEVLHAIYLDKAFEMIVRVSERLLKIDLSEYYNDRVSLEDVGKICDVICSDSHVDNWYNWSKWQRSLFLWKRYIRLIPFTRYVPKKPKNGLSYLFFRRQCSILIKGE